MYAIFPPLWLSIPFITFLLLIAIGPLLCPMFWHKYYKKISICIAAFVMGYYCFILNNTTKPIEAIAEYLQFIILISSLYITTGGILVQVQMKATPWINCILLAIAALFSNLIGTTGASMLFIRPYLRLNKTKIQVYHIVFFIFIVSNIGGALTPIGDPPLFLGFLKGVPFSWTLIHNSLPCFVAIFLLLVIFFCIDTHNQNTTTMAQNKTHLSPTSLKIVIQGRKNFIWLAMIIGTVFLDPTLLTWLPSISYHGHTISFVRELIMLLITGVVFFTTDKHILSSNAFSLAPLYEVCFIFIGIFGSMLPALEWIGRFAQSDIGKALITPTNLYWATGFFSSFLDNAPTYLNFTAASMASQGADIALIAHVKAYAAGGIYPHSVVNLQAIAIASVFFGAMTYIGNGPNFMIKAIAEQNQVKMPSFSNYILKFSLPILLPILFIIWFIFFYCSI